MGIGTDVRDVEVVEAEVVIELSSTSKTIWSKTVLCSSAWRQQPQRPLCVRFSSTTIDEDRLAARPAPPVRISGRVWSRHIGWSVRAPHGNVELSGDVIRTTR